jgi:predicted lipoprotein with Yx(FWY)xxD motif
MVSMFRCIGFAMAAALVALSANAATTNVDASAPGKTGEVKGQSAMLTQNGLTLYVFDEDRDGVSNCDKTCTTPWPPLRPNGRQKPSGDWTIITRHDGSKQWSYKGRPVYTWYRDKRPGQAEGDGFNGNRWHIARP